MSLIPPFTNELVIRILSFAELDSLIKLTQISRGLRTLIYSTSATFQLWLHGYMDVRETTQEGRPDLGHQIFRHRKRAIGTLPSYGITLGDPPAREFLLFTDGFLTQSKEWPDTYEFHWATSLRNNPLNGDPARVDIGPDVHRPSLEVVSADYMVIVWDDVLNLATKIRVVYLGDEKRVENLITGLNHCDLTFDFLQSAELTLSLYGDWLGILVERFDKSQGIFVINIHPEADREPRLIASSYSLNTHITGFSVVNKMFLLVGTNGSILIFKYTLPGRRQPILRLWLDERVVAMWVHRSPFTLFPKLSSRDFEPAKTDRELLVVRFVTPDSGVHTKPRGYLGRVLVTTTPIFDFLTKQYPPGTILNPGEWRRSILLLEYLPLPGLLGHMAFFVSGTRMVLPVGEEDGECVKYVECNFDPRWAMFVDWMARCGDEVARGWTIKNRGPFIVSSRSFRAPRTTAVAITYDHKVFISCSTPGAVVHPTPD